MLTGFHFLHFPNFKIFLLVLFDKVLKRQTTDPRKEMIYRKNRPVQVFTFLHFPLQVYLEFTDLFSIPGLVRLSVRPRHFPQEKDFASERIDGWKASPYSCFQSYSCLHHISSINLPISYFL